jgi:hypothetical protein
MQNNPVSMEDQVPSSNIPQQEGNYYVDPNGERYQDPAQFDQAQMQMPERVNFNFQEMRQKALQDAIEQVTTKRGINPEQPPQVPFKQEMPMVVTRPEPQVVYVKRNMTVAELLLTLLLACGIVTGVQLTWNFATDLISRIEIKGK